MKIHLILLLFLIPVNIWASEKTLWNYQTYLDLGYGYSFNKPENNVWRSKSTANIFATPKINLAMVYLGKDAVLESPWGMELGLQAGINTDGLVPSPPPQANEPKKNADYIRYLYRANASYRFPVGNGLVVSAGLINSFVGHESYLSMDNSNYTIGYLTDNVPYFFLGAQAAYPVNDKLNLSILVVDGWNYLARSNNNPGYGAQAVWHLASNLTFTQNLYYGPEQQVTDIQYWRFFFDSIIAWQNERLLLALAIDGGTEKQAEIVGNPRSYWWSGAIWGAITQRQWQFALRPEFYIDDNGIITGAKQSILALTASAAYDILPENTTHTITAKVEYRYDRSTGLEGGFYKGSDNHLTPDQSSVFLSLVWRFEK